MANQNNRYDPLVALSLAKQDRQIRGAVRKGEEYVAAEIDYKALLEFVQSRVSSVDEYRRVLSSAMENGGSADDDLKNIILTLLNKYEQTISSEKMMFYRDRIFSEMTGLGIIQEYYDDPEVEEINCYGPGPKQIEIVSGKYPRGFIMLEEGFENAQAVLDITKKMVRQGGMIIDQKTPCVDSYMESGVRISAMIAPVIAENRGAVFSIRKQSKSHITVEEYIEKKMGTKDEFGLIQLLFETEISGAFIGATGSGKTTLLNCMMTHYEKSTFGAARIFIIEESRELTMRPGSKTIYTAVVDEPNPVDAPKLLRSSLRFHPDFITSAEMRGEEAMNAMASAQTGHMVWSTFHAEDCANAYQRLLTMVKQSGTDLSENLLLRNLVQAFPVIISSKQLKDGSRRITGIYEATDVDSENKVIGHYIYKMQVKEYFYDADGMVEKVKGFHARVGDLSDAMAQKIFDNCGKLDLVKKYARKGWEPTVIGIDETRDENREYEEF